MPISIAPCGDLGVEVTGGTLGEILDAIALLRDYTGGLEFDAFAANIEIRTP